MLNPNLTNILITSPHAAGTPPPALDPIRPFPKSRTTTTDLVNALANSKSKDPYEDPEVIKLGAKLYIQSLGQLDQAHYHRELERRAAELETHKDAILEQLQEAFDETAGDLVKNAAPIKGVKDPATIDPRTTNRATATAAMDTIQGLMALENIIKAWHDVWMALGNGAYGNSRGLPYTYMTPNAEQWEQIKDNPTIWEAVHNGIELTLADTPERVGNRYQGMLRKIETDYKAARANKHPSLLPADGYGTYKP